MLTVRSILCPVDFSEQSRRALVWASDIAQGRGSEVIVLSVVEPLLAQAAGIRLGVDLARTEIEPALRAFVEAALPERVRQASRIRMEVTTGRPSDVILETGHLQKVELIVMGTHGLGGLRKLLLGSTAEEVVRRTTCPVLVVPASAEVEGD
jgi:universal stress protein A